MYSPIRFVEDNLTKSSRRQIGQERRSESYVYWLKFVYIIMMIIIVWLLLLLLLLWLLLDAPTPIKALDEQIFQAPQERKMN